ncbi:MAG: SRPBCC family protein [Cystobacter sp.]
MNRTTEFARTVVLTLLAVSHIQCQGMSGIRKEINPHAATVARTELLIDASPKAIWSVLTDIDRWTELMPEIASARLEGPLAPGSVIFWEPPGQVVESRLVVVEAERRLIWNGTDGAVHVWELIPMANGTLLRNEESIDTWTLDGPMDGSAFLTKALHLWNSRIARLAAR